MGQQFGQQGTGLGGEVVGHGLGLVGQAAGGHQEEAGHLGHLHQGLGARLQQRRQAGQVGRVELQPGDGPGLGQVFRQQGGQAFLARTP